MILSLSAKYLAFFPLLVFVSVGVCVCFSMHMYLVFTLMGISPYLF